KGDDAAPAPTAEAGQATVEFAGVIFIVLFLMLLIWQIGLWGISAAYTSHASDEAAREAGIGASLSQIEDKALDNVPGWFRDNMTVRLLDGSGAVQVRSKMPLLLPGVTVNKLVFTSETPVVREDN
ncbi:MAG: pilus assembly protein, partial [Actinomycetales bacterium]